MTRPRFYALALALAAVIGTAGTVAALQATPPTAPHTEPHRVALSLPVVPVDPAAALAADGAGSLEDVRAAACTGDPAALAAAGWTAEQLAQLPAVAAVDCPTDTDPAPASPAVLPADPCALGVDQLEAAGLTEAEALARRTPCSAADTARAAASSSSAPARRTSTSTRRPASSSSPAAPASTSPRVPAAPAPVAVDPHPAMADGPDSCTDAQDWDGAHCVTRQTDAERIGRQIDGPGGQVCTVVAVDPDRLQCTPAQP